MEDILSKDIFNDKILFRLSPDYNPSELLLRMQLRRSMVKYNRHNHEFYKSDHWQRKSPKRTKNSCKISKEIVKIRNGFHTMDLKNQIMLKRTTKSSESSKTKNDGDLLMDFKTLEEVINEKYQSNEDTERLVIYNDNNFKINNKPKQRKFLAELEMKSIEKNYDKCHLRPISEKDYKDTNENILKIDCTFAYKSPASPVNEMNVHQEINLVDTKYSDNNLWKPNIDSENCDKQISDLQNFLIMMAISPQSNENENEADKTVYNKHEITNDTINEIYNPGNILRSSPIQNEEICDYLNVNPLRVIYSDRQKHIINKYITKWKVYICNRKQYMVEQRKTTLDRFFDKLEKKKINVNQNSQERNKTKLLLRDYNTYQHRYKVQKHIIALQKAKLEDQNRLIEELKYNKIVDATRQSVDAMKEDVRKTYYEIDRQLKPKIKCLTNELKIKDIEEPSLVLHCLKVPQFLQRMEKRAREREEKHAMIRERRRQMEEERVRLKQQAEIAKAEMDKEEKLKRMKELREKRKREKIENIRKKQHAEKMRALVVMADLHYEKNLMSKFGIYPLRKLIEIKRNNIEKAKAHYTFQLKKNIFLHWMWFTEDMWFERNYKAEDFYRKIILKQVFAGIKQNHHEYVLKKQVAEDYYDLYVTQLVFRKLRKAIDILRKENELKWQKAVIYYNSNLLFRTFTCWRTLPALNALKREQEARKARWREKVLLVVPDYTPPDD